MERVLRLTQRTLLYLCASLCIIAAVVGCQHCCDGCSGWQKCWCWCSCEDRCADIPAGAIPQPVGTWTYELFNRQAGKAEADDFVIYYNEWLDNQSVLGPYGKDHLLRIISRLSSVPFPVMIQPEPDHPILTALRQRVVIEALQQAGYLDAAHRVVIGRGAAEGLFGEEAERLFPQMIQGGGGGGGTPVGIAGFGGGFTGYGAAGFAGGFGGVSGGGFGAFGGGKAGFSGEYGN